MDRRLQIHVLENIPDNGTWTWGWQAEIIYNRPALQRFERPGFTRKEYQACTVMLVESRKLVARCDYDIGTTHHPVCLTIDGLEYLSEIKSPRKQWAKRNCFPVTVAVATFLVAAAGIVVDVIFRILD